MIDAHVAAYAIARKKTETATRVPRLPMSEAMRAVTAWATMARYGVLYLVCTRAKIFGNSPSTARAYPSLDVPIIPDSSDPVTDTRAPMPTISPPMMARGELVPRMVVVAEASGAESIAS